MYLFSFYVQLESHEMGVVQMQLPIMKTAKPSLCLLLTISSLCCLGYAGSHIKILLFLLCRALKNGVFTVVSSYTLASKPPWSSFALPTVRFKPQVMSDMTRALVQHVPATCALRTPTSFELSILCTSCFGLLMN